MAGNAANAGSWADADVFIAPLGTAAPVGNAAWGENWKLVGLLDGDAGFEEERNSDSSDSFGWGGHLVESTDKNFKLTRKFTALEDNETVMKLVNPGSDITFTEGGYTGTIKVPKKEKFLIGFELRKAGKLKRLISKNYAQLDGWPTGKDSEGEITTIEVTVAIFPDSNGSLFTAYKGAPLA